MNRIPRCDLIEQPDGTWKCPECERSLPMKGIRTCTGPGPHPEPMPSCCRRVWNLLKSLARFVSDGLKKVSTKEYARRMRICHECTRRRGNWCPACGCNLRVKVGWRAMSCDDGKW